MGYIQTFLMRKAKINRHNNVQVTSFSVLSFYICVFFLTFCNVSFAERQGKVVSYNDPWERTNRIVFRFNDWLDRYTLKPIAKGYTAITPRPVRTVVTSFFSNIQEIPNTINAILQLDGKKTGLSIGRFIINSTLGLLGLLDVASTMGLKQANNDFGITLAKWGVPSGPYVVLPIFGPRTVRSAVGFVPDYFTDPIDYIKPKEDQWIAKGIRLIDTRARLLQTERLITGDRYSFIRDNYWQRREYQITGQLPEDDF